MLVRHSRNTYKISRKLSHKNIIIGFVFILTIVALTFTFLYSNAAHTKQKELTPLLNSGRNIRRQHMARESLPEKSLKVPRVQTNSTRYAFAACSVHAVVEAYCFYLPIAILTWRRLGFELISIFVGDFSSDNNQTKFEYIQFLAEQIHRFGGRVYKFQTPVHYAMKVSQLIRIFIGFLPFDFTSDDDFFIISDADLLPLISEQYMLAKDYPDGYVVNRFCCGLFTRRNKSYHMIPMSHLMIRKYYWREMILHSVVHKELINLTNCFHPGLNESYEHQYMKGYTKQSLKSLLLDKNKTLNFDILSLYVRHEFQQVYDIREEKGGAGWDMDQKLITMILFDYINQTVDGQNLKIHERALLNRLDPGGLPTKSSSEIQFSNYGDAHLTHEIFELKFWSEHVALFRYLFNETIADMLTEYYGTYLRQRASKTSKIQ